MRRRTPALLAIFLGFCLTSAAFAIDVPLKYQKHPAETEDFYPSGSNGFEVTLKKPSGDWKLPALISERPLYAIVKIGDTERLCILDRQKEDSKLYDRIYFDSNGNSNLTDDPVIDGTVRFGPENRYGMLEFPAIDTKIEVDGKSLPYSFSPLVYIFNLKQLAKSEFDEKTVSQFVNFIVRLNCSYTGEFQIGNQKYSVILGDSNCNGLFNERFSVFKFKKPPPGRRRVYSLGDRFYITTGGKMDYYDSQILGDLLQVRDKLFKISVSTAEGKMTLTPVTDNLISVQMTADTERLSLYTEDEKHCLMAYLPSKMIKVPAGKYRLYSYQVFKKDKQGDLWRLNATATTESPWVSVEGKGKTVVELGEPYIPLVEVRVRENRSRVSIGFDIEGKAKEFVTDLSHISGEQTQIALSKEEDLGHRPKEPTYKIVKTDGEVVTQGSFRYG
ncbi:MAG: hypothetical protein PVF66_08865 [Candidatus Aminicenantes bacterium]